MPWIFSSPGESVVTLVNNQDVSEYVIMGSLNISDEITNKVNTCSFRTYDVAGEFVPENGDVVNIIDVEGNLIFAGNIVSKTESRIGLNPGTGTELLEYVINCQDYTKILQKRLIIETFQNKTCKQIIQEILSKYFPSEGITTLGVEDGPIIKNFSCNYIPADRVFANLANISGYQWYIDYAKDIHFFFQDSSSVTYAITDDTDNWTDLKINPDVSQLRNRVFVRGGIYYSDPYVQNIKTQGAEKEYLLAYTPSFDDFSLTVNSVQRTVGLDQIDKPEDYDFMLNRKEKSLKLGNTAWAMANKPLAADTIISVTYNYEIPVLVVQEDTDSIQAVKAIEGGDGVYEYVVIDKNINSLIAARERALAELRDYGNPLIKGTVKSYECHGIKSGDLMTINSTRRGLASTYLIQSVKIKQIAMDTIEYTINFSGKLYGLVDILISLFKKANDIVIGIDEVLDAFNAYFEVMAGTSDSVPVIYTKSPPFKWSNDAGSTVNKLAWNLGEWS